MRQAATNNLVKIIQRIKELLTAHPGSAVAISCFKSLKTIGSGMCAGEESALGDVVPLLLSAIRGRKMALYAVPALSPLAYVRCSISHPYDFDCLVDRAWDLD